MYFGTTRTNKLIRRSFTYIKNKDTISLKSKLKITLYLNKRQILLIIKIKDEIIINYSIKNINNKNESINENKKKNIDY